MIAMIAWSFILCAGAVGIACAIDAIFFDDAGERAVLDWLDGGRRD